MQSFKKSERLCLTRLKELLFDKGKVLSVYPFRVFYICTTRESHPGPGSFNSKNNHLLQVQEKIPDGFLPALWQEVLSDGFASNPFPAQMLVSVPKKRFKKAIQRNRLKRLVKEAYRKNKEGFYSLLNQRGLVCLVAFVYTGSQILPFHEVESKIVVILQKLGRVVSGTVIADAETR
ncbi:MAG TPA: ribonuclease P protein component [Bacteroidales bacterium]|nr:ribonuclease P protein component [Bacteroidales bacterium]